MKALSRSARRALLGAVVAPALGLALLALPRAALAQDTQPAPSETQAAPSEPAPSAPAQATLVGNEPASKDGPARQTHPRYWLTATGAITFGGAYVANAVLAPIAAISPPDGAASPSTLWYITPVVGPFALAAKLSQFDTGLRRFEWIDGTLQTVGVAMFAASFLFPVENEKVDKAGTQTATIHPVVSPRFVGATGTF